MSWSLRRTVLSLGLIIVICTAAFLTPDTGLGQAQPVQIRGKPGLPPPPAETLENQQAIELPTDPKVTKQLEAAKDYIADAEWEVATKILQDLLERPEDYQTKVDSIGVDGKKTYTWLSIRKETDKLIASLPAAGKDFYKLRFGPTAAEMLKQAKTAGDIELLTLITRKYLHTDAGGEAVKFLAAYRLERGEFITAALCYEKLLSREGADKLDSKIYFQAYTAFESAGDKVNAAACWEKLRTFQRVTINNNETRSVEELRDWVARNGKRPSEGPAKDCYNVGYGPSRNRQGDGGTAYLMPQWKIPLVRTTEAENYLHRAEDLLQARGQPVLSARQPVTASTVDHNSQKISLVMVKSIWGLHAINMKNGKVYWETPSGLSMDRMIRDARKTQFLNSWVGQHLSTRPNILFENSTVGTLSTDGSLVFMIDDFDVPPMLQNFNQNFGNPNQLPHTNEKSLDEAINASKLQAFELSTGKLKWEVGGLASKDEKVELADSYFLGAPLSLGGKLYVLTEKQQDLRLACLDPATGNVLSVQTLATARDKMNVDVWRRVQATHLAYGEGILICPTNSGALLGVDLLSNSLLWAYPYRDKNESQPEVWNPQFGGRPPPGFQPGPDGMWHNPNSNINTKWKVSPPLVVDGKVVFTAPDASKIHCISLRDGAAVWSVPRASDDLYLAGVYSGKAVIVGKDYVKALTLAKGEVAWNLSTGTPSGYGVASANIYYLPVKEVGPNKEPEICAIDVEKGQIVAHTKSREKRVPGNLLFYEGNVLSQSAYEVVAYPQLDFELKRIDELLKANENDAEGLYKRGQLRLDKGDLAGAIEDLHRSLKNKPSEDTLPHVREKLYDSLTELFQRDFNKAEPYVQEYEELCNVPNNAAEQRRRRGTFLCLVAKGKEAQGKLVEAFERYQEFATEAAKYAKEAGVKNEEDKLLTVVDEPTVRANPEVWSGGRIAAMVAKAQPEDRKPLEDLLAKKWAKIKATEDVDEIKNFVRIFGSLFSVGKEARLELATRLMEDNSPTALLEAEQQLTLLRGRGEDPSLAGRAVEMLARLNTRKGLLEDASYYYRVLRDQYANVKVRDSKTGAELFNDMATDKRLLPYLDIPTTHGVTGKNVKVEEQRGTNAYQQQVYEFGQSGEPLPFFQKHRLSLRFDYHQLKISDKMTGEEKTKALTKTNFQNMVYGNGQPNLPKYCYMSVGHLVVLPVAHMVFGIDPIRGEVLWERNLFGDKHMIGQVNGTIPTWNQFIVDPKDNSIQLIYPDGWVQRLGGAGTLEGSVLCLHTHDGLLAIDPVTNQTLWMRSSINARCQIFNDDQYVYIVELNPEGQATTTRVLRAYDGVSVNVPDFSAQYQKRVRQAGRNLLLSETDAKGQLTLRLYDVLTGKDLWKDTYAANSRVLQSEDADFSGVVEPDGTVRVVDLRNGKEAMKTRMDPKFLDKVTSVHLLYDRQYFFVACNGPTDPALNPWGGVMTNLMPGTGLRSLAINGEVYCFDAQTGKTKWHNALLNQMIVLDHFADMPILLATARYNKWANINGGRNVINVVALEAITKNSGKYVYKPKETDTQNWQQFHALDLDPKKGTITLVNYNSKIVFTATNDSDKKSGDAEKKPEEAPSKPDKFDSVPPPPRK